MGQQLTDFFVVEIPDLPDPENAPFAEWLAALAKLTPDSETLLVGHSLGGTLILRYLEQTELPVHSFYLVAAPINDLARNDLHETGFFEWDFDWEKIKKNSEGRHILASTDDPTVPFWQAEYLIKNLEAEMHMFNNKGHFKETDLPELVEILRLEK